MRFLTFVLGFTLMSITLSSAPKVGELAPDFEINSHKGKKIKLSKFKGKVVLVDFWASWCRPCRAENPNVVEAYNKYRKSKFKNAKGFEVISISLDREEAKWKEAIKKDGLVWSSHGWDKTSEIARKYRVSSIPAGFLIDGEGKIVASGHQLRGLGLHLEIDKLLK